MDYYTTKDRDCGCTTRMDGHGYPFIVYCPLHKAAPLLYEACKQAQEGTGDWRGVIDLAIAKAEGKPSTSEVLGK